MPAGVCFKGEKRRVWQDQFSFAFSNFGIKDVWMIGPGDKIYQKCEQITSAAELPADRPLVVLQPQDGRNVKGTESLVDFVHPDDAIYMFGGSHDVMEGDDLGGRVPEHQVFIPFEKHECYAFAAAYITLWDRKLKHG